MHPATDPDLHAIVGDSPGDSYVWCSECLRWENLDNLNHSRPEVFPVTVRVLLWYARCLLSFAEKLGRIAMLRQARYLVQTNRGISEGGSR